MRAQFFCALTTPFSFSHLLVFLSPLSGFCWSTLMATNKKTLNAAYGIQEKIYT